jgi:hypothetical protein
VHKPQLELSRSPEPKFFFIDNFEGQTSHGNKEKQQQAQGIP